MHPDGRESYLRSSLFFLSLFLSDTAVKIRMRERERARFLTGLTLSGLKTRSILDSLRRFPDTEFLSSPPSTSPVDYNSIVCIRFILPMRDFVEFFLKQEFKLQNLVWVNTRLKEVVFSQPKNFIKSVLTVLTVLAFFLKL